MFILHLSLGGCLRTPPIRFGITADTGGHIAYILDAAGEQASLPGTHVTIVTRLFHDPGLGAQHAMAREPLPNGVTIERIATPSGAYLEKEALDGELPAFAEGFCRRLEALPRRPDVIHAHFADAAAVALLARRRLGIPVVYTPHALGIDKRVRGLAGHALEARIAAERRAIAEADALLVSTRDEAERQVAAYDVAPRGPVVRVSPGVPRHGVPRHGARPAAAADGATLAGRLGDWLDRPERPIVLAVARPVRKKNLAALPRAFAAVPALAARANLVILAGQGGTHASAEERDVLAELHRLCAAPALRGRVALPARHGPADVAALYRRAARGGAFANPALHEPFGLTLLEAADAGVPVVATREGGPAEILAAIGHGLLVDPRDDAAIGAALLRLLEDPALHRHLSEAGRRGALRHDWGQYARRSVALYASLRPGAWEAAPGGNPIEAARIGLHRVAARSGARA